MAEKVSDVLKDIQQKGKGPNRFSKKSFNRLVKAMLNDTSFTAKVAQASGTELIRIEEVAVTEGFRKFLKKVLEKAGIDKKDSEVVLGDSFTIDNVEGLYEFFAEALYQYMDAGNKFDLLPKEDFKGSLYLKKIAAGSREASVRNPQTNEDMGKFEFGHKPYTMLTTTSPCPEYLKTKKKL
jgi:hypothetical protein